MRQVRGATAFFACAPHQCVVAYLDDVFFLTGRSGSLGRPFHIRRPTYDDPMSTKPPVIVHYAYRPKRQPKKKARLALPTRIVTIPSKRARKAVERPEAEPEAAVERPRIVTANKPKTKPYTGPAARDEDVDEAALEQARAFLKKALRPPNN